MVSGATYGMKCVATLMILFALVGGAASAEIDTMTVQIDPWCNNSFRVRLRSAAPSPPQPYSNAAVIWSNTKRGDSVLCMSDACTHSESTSGYAQQGMEGYVPDATVPVEAKTLLSIYYSHEHTDNLVGPSNNSVRWGKFIFVVATLFIE